MTNQKKVLFIADSLNNGGAERQLTLLIKYLPSGWETMVWSLDGGVFADIIVEGGAKLFIKKRRWQFDVTPAFNLFNILRAWKPDIIHSWGGVSMALSGPICKIMGIPLIDGIIRSGMVTPRRSSLNRWSMKWASLIVANSQAGLRAWHVNSDRGRVVYNGFDVERLILCKEHNIIDEGLFKVVMTGRMDPEKDYSSFFSAARALIKSGKDNWHFFAVGDGVIRKELMQGNKDLSDQGIIEFCKPGTEVLPIVGRSHVGVLMTNTAVHEEGCSNTIMEYMACGLPVICVDSGGNRELVVDGETGYIIPVSYTHLTLPTKRIV